MENENLPLGLNGEITAYELRKAEFLANTLIQNSLNEISKFALKIYAQAISTGHMRDHAMISSDYNIKFLNLIYNNKYNE